MLLITFRCEALLTAFLHTALLQWTNSSLITSHDASPVIELNLRNSRSAEGKVCKTNKILQASALSSYTDPHHE